MNSNRAYTIKKKETLSEKEKKKTDEFILKESVNGEFINTCLFLDYHPSGRFVDDSIVVWETNSGAVVGCMMAAQTEEGEVVSHPGTTFAGPVVDSKSDIQTKEEILGVILHYYESKYKKIELKLLPGCYSLQPNDTLSYFLLRRGYIFGMTALANIVNLTKIKEDEEIMHLFTSGRRNHVKKAIKEKRFYFKEEREVVPKVWMHMNENLATKFHSSTTHTLNEINDLRERFPDRILPFYVYTNEQEYGAFALVFCFKNVFHTQYLDVNYKLSSSYPNLYLIYMLMKEACARKYSFISFGASTENRGQSVNYGLYHYKNGYGGGDLVLPVYTFDTADVNQNK